MAAGPWLVIAILCMAGATSAATQEQLLRDAITSPSITRIDLVEDIFLTSDLPQLPGGKVLAVVGKKQVKIDGRRRYRMFASPADRVVSLTLENLVLTGAKQVAVDLTGVGTKLTIKGVTFTKNPTALDLYLIAATVTNSKFTSNTNTSVRLQSDENVFDKFVFRNCEFTSNTRSGSDGGALIANFLAEVVLEKCTFNRNSAVWGGAILIKDGFVTIRGSTFSNNVALEDGGAISLFANDFCGLDIIGSTFKGNVARTGDGGALRLSSDGNVGSLASVSTTTFDGNKAPKGRGGAFFLQSNVDIIFCRSTFTRNTALLSSSSNGFVVGPSNTITTTPRTTIPNILVDTDAGLEFKSGEKCVA